MKTIEIKRSSNIEGIDSLYSSIFNEINELDEYKIILPKKIDNLFYSMNVSLLQFVSTIFKTGRLKTIQVKIDSNNRTEIDDVYDEEFFFPIISFLNFLAEDVFIALGQSLKKSVILSPTMLCRSETIVCTSGNSGI